MSALKRLRQENCQKFEMSLGYTVTVSQNSKIKWLKLNSNASSLTYKMFNSGQVSFASEPYFLKWYFKYLSWQHNWILDKLQKKFQVPIPGKKQILSNNSNNKRVH